MPGSSETNTEFLPRLPWGKMWSEIATKKKFAWLPIKVLHRESYQEVTVWLRRYYHVPLSDQLELIIVPYRYDPNLPEYFSCLRIPK